MKMLYLIILSVLLYSRRASSNNTEWCGWKHKGIYCKDDLSGYVECDGYRWGRNKIIKDVTCPPTTRCVCFLDNRCEYRDLGKHQYEVIKEKEICRPLEKPFPIREILHLSYQKTGWKELSPEHEVRYNEFGEIKQDLRKQSVLYTWRDNNEKEDRFKLIIPDGYGLFDKVI